MTDEKILQKAIKKAVKNGWERYNIPKIAIPCDLHGDYNYEEIEDTEDNLYYSFIFSHSFAKAFWGEKFSIFDQDIDMGFYEMGAKAGYEGKAYKYHLMRMALEKEPLKYLEQFLC